jgi:hypothetical protein
MTKWQNATHGFDLVPTNEKASYVSNACDDVKICNIGFLPTNVAKKTKLGVHIQLGQVN